MPVRFEKLLKMILRGLFAPAARYPADPRIVFVLALCCFAGLTSLSLQAGPETLESLLPKSVVIGWGLILTAGSFATLIGVMQAKEEGDLEGIFLEQVGSVAVGVSTVFYGGIAIWVAGTGAIQPVGIILAFGLACFLRWLQLQLLLNRIHKAQSIALVQKAIHEEVQRHEP